MDQKMKNFDRNIEQLMNESEVAPPFGMWNRISAELDAEIVAAPTAAAANSPIAQRTVYGFIAGALLIGASFVAAYVMNDSFSDNKPVNSNVIVVTHTAPAITNEIPGNLTAKETQPVATTADNENRAAKTVEPAIVPVKVKAKPAIAALPKNAPASEEIKVVSKKARLLQTDVPVPTISTTTQETETANEPYYFPAIDNTSDLETDKPAVAAKTTKAEKTEEKERSFSIGNDIPRIKFRPKKHRSFSYGKIIRKR